MYLFIYFGLVISILCSILPQTEWLKTIYIYYLTVSVLRSRGQPSVQSHEAAVRTCPACIPVWGYFLLLFQNRVVMEALLKVLSQHGSLFLLDWRETLCIQKGGSIRL